MSGVAGGVDANENLKNLYGQRDRIEQALNIHGSIWGKFGDFRQNIATEEYSFDNQKKILEREAGRPLTDEEVEKLKDTVSKLQDVLKQKDEELKKSKESALKTASDTAIKIRDNVYANFLAMPLFMIGAVLIWSYLSATKRDYAF